MESKFICPCCGKDITAQVLEFFKIRNAERMRKALEQSPEKSAERNRQGAKNLADWRKANPGKAHDLGVKASSARTAETFARQGETIRETMRRKTIKFAELVAERKATGVEITAKVQEELMKRATEIVKAELKAERKLKKSRSL